MLIFCTSHSGVIKIFHALDAFIKICLRYKYMEMITLNIEEISLKCTERAKF